MNALLLEDDPIVAKDIEQKILNQTDIDNIFTCHSIKEAAKIVATEDFQVSFIDIEIDKEFVGFNIAKSIRQKKHAGVIYLTGYSDDKTIDKMSETFPDGYILKPYNERQLVAVTKQVIAKYYDHTHYGNINFQFEDGFVTNTRIELFQNVLNSLYLVSITDNLGNIVYVNSSFSETCGYLQTELVGKNHRIVSSGYHDSSFFKTIWESLNAGKVWRGEICNRKKDRELYWVYSTIFPLRDADEKLYFMSVRTDISNKKSLEQDYKKLLETKAEELMESRLFLAELLKTDQINNFAATLSHEIKRPLTSINMQLQVILMEHKDLDESIKSKLIRLEKSSKKTTELASDINKIFKKESDLKKNINLNSFISEIVEFADQLFCYEDVDFLFENDNCSTIETSEEILFISIFNLIKNAIEAFPTNTEDNINLVKIKVSCNDSLTKISVTDNAGGIEKEFAEKLFSSRLRTTKEKGSGLGLVITKSILKQINANIELTENSSIGATFTIELNNKSDYEL